MEAPPPIFTYNPSSDHHQELPQKPFSASLEIHVHHARNIHNICIYDNQDVYAKFSLTCDPDEAISTAVVAGGGKNPEFNQSLTVKIRRKANCSVLKCEIWMMSRAKNYLDDQLLGFALVPISSVLGKGKVTQDFSLSSTDLFHSPAGTIKLSLSLSNPNAPTMGSASLNDDVDSTSEFVSDEGKNAAIAEDVYSRIEFPDIRTASESQQMVSELFAKNEGFLRTWLDRPVGSFLHLGSAPANEDCEMLGNSWDEHSVDDDSKSPHGSIQTSGILSSTMTSLGDDRNSADSKERRSELGLAENEVREETMGMKKQLVEGDESAILQQQIVGMYMRSMQQFTESLGKMKLPMELGKKEKAEGGDDEDDNGGGVLIQNKKMEMINVKEMSDKDNSRVFYGSRAFF